MAVSTWCNFPAQCCTSFFNTCLISGSFNETMIVSFRTTQSFGNPCLYMGVLEHRICMVPSVNYTFLLQVILSPLGYFCSLSVLSRFFAASFLPIYFHKSAFLGSIKLFNDEKLVEMPIISVLELREFSHRACSPMWGGREGCKYWTIRRKTQWWRWDVYTETAVVFLVGLVI